LNKLSHVVLLADGYLPSLLDDSKRIILFVTFQLKKKTRFFACVTIRYGNVDYISNKHSIL